jgi:RNA polymerase sigma-B factor
VARKSFDFKLTPEQQKMAVDNINLARREAWRIQRTTGIEYSVLEGAAFLGLCKAVHRYDPESGYKFSSLATPTIRGELLHWVRDKTYALRLSHKMREDWIKGRRMVFDGCSDIKIAETLGISLQDWQETRSACSGPPLELKDQSTPSDPLEPDEIDFKVNYRAKANDIVDSMNERDKQMLSGYYKGEIPKPPIRQFNTIINDLKERKVM